MCSVCGCGSDELHFDGERHESRPGEASAGKAGAGGGFRYRPPHTHDHDHGRLHEHSHAHPHAEASAVVPGEGRLVRIEQDILAKNDAYARANRQWLDERGILALNLVSGPGAGKTSLLVRSIEALRERVAIKVIEGDQQTSNDAERIRAASVPAMQINTGKGCHLDGHMVGHAIEHLQPAERSLLLIENVGNLVCPAGFALGEHHKVVILSVTEGEDKPLKYPDIFRAADVLLLNKCDLLPHLDFDVELAEANARRVNPRLVVFRVSARTGEGMADWLSWVEAEMQAVQRQGKESVDALKARIAELEKQLGQSAGQALAPVARSRGER